MKDYIKKSLKESQRALGQYYVNDSIMLYVISPLTNSDINIQEVLGKYKNIFKEPSLLNNIDSILIGDFNILNQRDLTALYYESTIYVTNKQDSEQDLLDDLVHETCHSIEQTYKFEIYSDDSIEQEFLGKRKKLYHILKSQGYDVQYSDFIETEYDLNLDNFLYNVVGYDRLGMLTAGLFISPYDATSLSEYFVGAYEDWLLGAMPVGELRRLCPNALAKVEELMDDGTGLGENDELDEGVEPW